MNTQAVRELTKKGCIIAKEAAENLKDRDMELIKQLDSTPMYLNIAMLKNLRNRKDNQIEIKFKRECPEFMGTDLEMYGGFEEGQTGRVPEDEGEKLIEKGYAEKCETLENHSTSLETSYSLVQMVSGCPEFVGTDLEIYGEFEEGDITRLPEYNAEILVNRGNAEWFEHVLSVYESGSRKLEVTHNGDSHETEEKGFRKELFVEAECSCGESFNDEEDAWNHVKEVRE